MVIQFDEKRVVTKGNIPINDNLLNKYSSAEEIFESEKHQKRHKIFIENDILELNNINLNYVSIKEIKKLAYRIFGNYHTNFKFKNDNNIILVNHSGINESVQKIFHNRIQRDLLREHLLVFSKLGKIIENAILVNQGYERKNRSKYNSWNYYVEDIVIDNKEYTLEFEIASLDSGENHYRVQRLELK